jgi:2-polyprenyl-3-methyl-5-hydroxy-6-metoxy-1,4-benzoquinol methylase
MEQNNLFDNDEFFRSYKELRERKVNCNVLIEQPAMKELLPDLKGKDVLDLGCGYGCNCRDFIVKGAKSVTGIDISKKMLDVAKTENNLPGIRYLNMDMNDISGIDGKFDLVYSSL